MSDHSQSRERRCGFCPAPITDPRARFCSQRCRQAAFRLRERARTCGSAEPDSPKRCAYADPPYPDLAFYYRDEPDYGGEVDHVALIARLATFDGWALSTSAKALRKLLPLCSPEVRVCAWVKPNPAPPATFGLHSRWEPLLVMPARRLRPGMADWFNDDEDTGEPCLIAQPAKLGTSRLFGRKPLAFCAFMFNAIGMRPGDTLADMFPGSGIVGCAWDELGTASHLGRTTRHGPAATTGV